MTTTEEKAQEALKQELAETTRTAERRLGMIREFLVLLDANPAGFIVPNKEPGRERTMALVDKARLETGQKKAPGERADA